VAIIMNGSPLFTGDAGSGESEIRRWIIENDWLEAIIALPEQLFYNTGIATYVWILTNRKPARRRGKVQLIDASAFWEPRRRSLGDKRRDIADAHREQIIQLYLGFAEGERVKIFDNTELGYRKIRVERPEQWHYHVTSERTARLWDERAFQRLVESRKTDDQARAAEEEAGRRAQKAIIAMLEKMVGQEYVDCRKFTAALRGAVEAAGLDLSTSVQSAIHSALRERDEDAEICRDSHGRLRPDKDLRDYERVPLGQSVEDYFAQEVQPYVPDAWLDKSYTDKQDNGVGRVGYEINFNRYFYQYQPPRQLDKIQRDIQASQAKIVKLLRTITGMSVPSVDEESA
jgi:type I restriction enzyme M protein